MPIDPVSYKDQNIIRPEVRVLEKSEIDKNIFIFYLTKLFCLKKPLYCELR